MRVEFISSLSFLIVEGPCGPVWRVSTEPLRLLRNVLRNSDHFVIPHFLSIAYPIPAYDTSPMHHSPATEPWRFLNTDASQAHWNMAVDEAMFDACRLHLVPPTVRVYTWRPSAVSLGYAQVLEEELDLNRCRQYGIDVVRRQTGGRAVLHADELTYSLVAPENHPAIGQTAYENYRRVSEALVHALRFLDIPGELVHTPSSSPEGADGVCFSSAARFEIVVQKRKLVGSAQRRARGMVLQHGSLLLGPGHKRLPLLMPHSLYARRQALMQELSDRTTTVSEATGHAVSFDEMAGLVKRGFEEHLGISFHESTLTAKEHTEAARLAAEKYGTHEWTTRSKPRHIPR